MLMLMLVFGGASAHATSAADFGTSQAQPGQAGGSTGGGEVYGENSWDSLHFATSQQTRRICLHVCWCWKTSKMTQS